MRDGEKEGLHGLAGRQFRRQHQDMPARLQAAARLQSVIKVQVTLLQLDSIFETRTSLVREEVTANDGVVNRLECLEQPSALYVMLVCLPAGSSAEMWVLLLGAFLHGCWHLTDGVNHKEVNRGVGLGKKQTTYRKSMQNDAPEKAYQLLQAS
jgi:hypothetical protein